MPYDATADLNDLYDQIIRAERATKMPIQIKAKMRCSEVKKQEGLYEGDEGYENVQLYAVYSEDPKDENFSYSKATPSADARLLIANSAAFGAFKEGKEYVVTFQEVQS